MDPVFKSSLARLSDVKAADKQLARAQALVVDSVGPPMPLLTRIGEEDYKVEEAERTDMAAMELVGNASHHIAKMRPRRILKSFNHRMQDMTEEDKMFKSLAPLLFGQGFETKMKERSESLTILASCSRS